MGDTNDAGDAPDLAPALTKEAADADAVESALSAVKVAALESLDDDELGS